jgi:hypothetical protein
MTDDLEQALGPDRRTFVKRLVMGAAFATPIVSSFTMSGIEAVFGAERRAIIGLSNCNTTVVPPSPPPNYPTEVICEFEDGTGTTFGADDPPAHVEVVVPPGAFLGGKFCTDICVFRGDLGALAAVVPPGETPQSAYAVVWNSVENPEPDALLPLTLTVTDPRVRAGDPIYKLDKVTGQPVQVGTASAGSWTVTFTEDPSFVVTRVGGGDDDDDDGDRDQRTQAQPPAAVAAQPEFTG